MSRGFRHAATTRVGPALALLAAVALLLALPVDGSSDGRSERALVGCGDAGCHGAGGPSSDVTPVLDGLPEAYTPGETYLLNVTVGGGRDPLPPPAGMHAGGFALGVTDGALAAPPGAEDVRVDDTTGNATHSKSGATQRAWTLVWTAPPPTAGAVTFHLAVVAVNGNGVPDPLDEWNTAAFTSSEGVVPDGPPPPTVVTSDAVAPDFGDSRLPALGAPGLALAVAAAALIATRARR